MSIAGTTVLCSNCTSLVNEADAVLHKQEKVRNRAKNLYNEAVRQRSHQDSVIQGEELLNSLEITIKEIKSDEGEVQELKQEIVEEESEVSFSQRGRKRKAAVFTEAIRRCDEASDDEDWKRQKVKRKRGRSKGGGPATRSTLVGKGLNGRYDIKNTQTRAPYAKVFNCPECLNVSFSKYCDLVSHRKECHRLIDHTNLGLKEIVLDSGVITFFNKDKTHRTDTRHPCKECTKTFLRKVDLLYHCETTHNDGKGKQKTAFKDRSYECQECGETFLFKYKLKLHINNNHLNCAGSDPEDFTCGECGCKLGSLSGLTFHMRKHHNKVLGHKKSSEFLCSDCGYLAPSFKKLRDHQKAKCGLASKERVQCEICGKTVLKVSLKMHHIKLHTEFKEKCEECGERFATKTDMLRHVNVVHRQILLYACKLCEEKFPTSDALRYHKVKAHQKASFFCEICSKSYKRIGELNTHMKRAHNDCRKVEVCRYCGKEYYDRSGLRNHLISKHKIPQEMTYTETYLKKKRLSGYPVSQQIQPLDGDHNPMQNQAKGVMVQHIEAAVVAGQGMDDPSYNPQQQLFDEAVVAAQSLERYQEASAVISSNPEEQQSLIVTEIPQNEVHLHHAPAVVIDQLGNIIPQQIVTSDQIIEDPSGTVAPSVIYHQLAPAEGTSHLGEL